MIDDDQIPESIKLRYSLYIPLLFAVVLWLVKLAEYVFGFSLTFLGIYPRQWFGLVGVITSPFIHSGFDHLISNTFPIVILWAGTLYFYRTIAYKVFFWVYLINGLGVWLFARSSFHIGASGLIYGLVCFVFFSGIIRQSTRLLALSLLVTFFYGGMIWGIFPLEAGVSWESHLFGALAGFFCALWFRHEGPQRPVYDIELEEDPEDDDDDGMTPPPHIPPEIRYIYRQKRQRDS